MLEQILTPIIQGYGPFGLLVVMVIQTLIAPIPSEAMIIFAAAIGIGLWKVVVFGGVGTLIGAVLAFWIARKGGRPIVEKLIGNEWVENLDEWVNQHGRMGIFVTRLIPIIPFDLISYITGVTSLSFKDYFVATLLGVFPRMLILALIGNVAGSVFKWIGLGLEVMIGLATVGFIVLIWLDRKGKIGGLKKFIFGKLMKRK
ncbi:MAG: TVP38/TMEM64 family protein [Candidatus Aenigmarchaeota archaeon]|nr:TVP38/TMEM64 family protein [Candidatus Aenigmarchaeota archaeon]